MLQLQLRRKKKIERRDGRFKRNTSAQKKAMEIGLIPLHSKLFLSKKKNFKKEAKYSGRKGLLIYNTNLSQKELLRVFSFNITNTEALGIPKTYPRPCQNGRRFGHSGSLFQLFKGNMFNRFTVLTLHIEQVSKHNCWCLQSCKIAYGQAAVSASGLRSLPHFGFGKKYSRYQTYKMQFEMMFFEKFNEDNHVAGHTKWREHTKEDACRVLQTSRDMEQNNASNRQRNLI